MSSMNFGLISLLSFALPLAAADRIDFDRQVHPILERAPPRAAISCAPRYAPWHGHGSFCRE
jgi:hypothetical protein